MKKQRTSTSCNQGTRGQEASEQDTIASAATSEEPSNQATTTKHPRHRPGCTCIVCNQPPSSKGPKHHTNCTCNVCMTVKRRFKTLMLQKKKWQFEKEEAEAKKMTSYHEMKKQITSTSCNQGARGQEASGHDTIANAATSEEPSNQATTRKHPRHRPGCTCIVCIQPPSSKGPKHHTNCTCNVCMTVKRRFKTLMLRKNKRQFEKEEAEANKKTEGNCSTYVHDDKASEVVPETNTEMLAVDDAGLDLNAIVYEDHNAAEASAKSEEDCSGDAKSDAS